MSAASSSPRRRRSTASPSACPIDERDALAPANPYGETKLAGERLLERAREAGDIAFTALRYFNACGADGARGEDHEPESHLVPLALRAARDGAAIAVFGDDYPTPDGTCVRDYVHVADLADAHIAALEALPRVQGAFNLGTGDGDSVREVLDTVEAVTGLRLARETAPRAPATRRRSWPATGARRSPGLAAAAHARGRGARRLGVDAGAPGYGAEASGGQEPEGRPAQPGSPGASDCER